LLLILSRSMEFRSKKGIFPGAVTLLYFFQTKDVSFDHSHRWKL
jgi:hypothetical protein